MAGLNPNPPIDDGEDVEIEVRPYKIEDYQAVFDLAKESRLEPWANAYWRTINGAKKSPLLFRAAVLAAAASVTWEDRAWIVVLVLFAEVAVLGAVAAEFFFPAWSFLIEEMSDYNLRLWSGGEAGSVLLVATAGARGSQELREAKRKEQQGRRNNSKEMTKRVVGAVGVRRCEEAPSEGVRMRLRLGFLCVSPEMRGRGLGGHLCSEALRRAAEGVAGATAEAEVKDAAEEATALLTGRIGFREKEKDPREERRKRSWWRMALGTLHGVERMEMVKKL